MASNDLHAPQGLRDNVVVVEDSEIFAANGGGNEQRTDVPGSGASCVKNTHCKQQI